ncbi:cell division protein CrgA [Herbiconiux sp.]|uniref:cell division protein CrgA n=1 Tax=Herbiconiux sp. TaxID=1871186 RepID=UPI0025B92715|nr:cell division protein CrgA [Herbiconiux sp.]
MDPLTLIVVALLGIGTFILIAAAIIALVISRRSAAARSARGDLSTVAPQRRSPLLRVGGVLLILGIIGFVVGLVWILTFFLSQGRAPIAGVFAWNILIGFAVLVPGFIVAVLGLVLTLVGRGPTVSRG